MSALLPSASSITDPGSHQVAERALRCFLKPQGKLPSADRGSRSKEHKTESICLRKLPCELTLAADANEREGESLSLVER